MLCRLVHSRLGWAVSAASLRGAPPACGFLLGPFEDGGVRRYADYSSNARMDEDFGAASAEEEERRPGPHWVHGIPIDAPRTLADYNRLMSRLASRKR